MSLPEIPVRDYRDGGMLAYVRDHAGRARHLLATVLAGLGPAGRALRPILPVADRLADRKLAAMADPYRDEIRQIRALVGRPGPVAFSLSYEFGCTARAFAGPGGPTLFRTLDWPFRGLGELTEIVMLPGRSGDWITATWPGVVGCLHGAAAGRFAAALNQAPERRSRLGRGAAWIAGRRRFLGGHGIAPPHLLRRVFEEAPDYSTARKMLAETPVAVPVIFTLSGTSEAERCTIERTETTSAIVHEAAAANHFASDVGAPHRWRPRGYDSAGRRAAILSAGAPPAPDAISPPVLNPLTRLALTASARGALSAAGYDGARPVTALTTASL